MPRGAVVHSVLSDLNEEQRKAVKCLHGPLLILAGAGSGKTRTLTHRIAHLMHGGVPPWQIVAVTFTNKASEEMKQRIANLLHLTDVKKLEFRISNFGFPAASLPVMGTFHSLCARILRRDGEHIGVNRSYLIYDEDDQERLMKEVLREMGIEESEFKARAALAYISRFKCEALSPSDASLQATTPRMQKIIGAYEWYQRSLRKANALDFDDLILETVKLFSTASDVLDRYQETWRYLNVDEYQDTNHAQYLLITLLAKKYRNICVIGDPDQSIYGFRGADIRNILEFERDYPDALRITLERNYRSTEPILTAANGVIEKSALRPKKTMWTERKEGPKVTVHELRDERSEAEEAIRGVLRLYEEGVPLREQVILYRTHAQSRLFEEACLRTSLPYRIVGGLRFYARREVKDVLAYLHLLANPEDTVSLLRILNVPSRKIGKLTLAKLQRFASEHTLSLWEALSHATSLESISLPTKERIEALTTLLTRYQRKARTEVVSELTQHLLEDLRFEEWLRDDTDEGEARWENVQELLSIMVKYDQLEPLQSLLSFLEEVALISEADVPKEGTGSLLTLMTLHLVKGLEFEHVTIVGCEEGIFPHSNSFYDREQLEEERRLMYVGMTRAKKHLRLLFARNRLLWGERQVNARSRFLDDLPEDVIECRSDDILSAFAWASRNGKWKVESGKLTPLRSPSGSFAGQDEEIAMEFNQDFLSGSLEDPFMEGRRVEHPAFGKGVILRRQGDVAEIAFDSGEKKRFALRIAPLRPL